VILFDTSIWIDHLRRGDPELRAALDRGEVAIHPHVIGELACGQMKNRAEILALLARLPCTPVATDDEALAFIETRALMGRGIGYTDIHLLAAVALLPGTRLRTRDRRLAQVAEELSAESR
jgi:predicted nucleic acid-binding protein